MYGKVNITENHLRILTLFTRGFNKNIYIREAARELNASPRTAQLILEDLERRGVLASVTRGKIRVFSLKPNPLARDYLILAEHYKRIAFLRADPLLQGIVEKIVPYLEGIAVLFGSYARQEQKKDSDIDIFVAGTADKAEIRKVSRLYRKPIDIKEYPPEIFEKSIRTDILIQEVLEDHIVLKGTEELVATALQWLA